MSDILRIVEFEREYLPGGKYRDKVLLAPAGEDFENTRTWHYIKHIIPKETTDRNVLQSNTYIAAKARWDVIQPRYEAWKQGEELPTEGTPLAAWGGISPAQAKALINNDVRSVEEVANMGDVLVDKLPIPNARRLRTAAQSFIDSRDASMKDAELAEMAERLRVMEQMLEEGLTDKAISQPEPPKRGRPKKQEAEAA